MLHEKVLILDFGSQYTQRIARRVRELNIYSEIHPYNKGVEINQEWKAIILSGSPSSVHEKNAPFFDFSKIKKRIPILGICYGAQFVANDLGGTVVPSKIREYGSCLLYTSPSPRDRG